MKKALFLALFLLSPLLVSAQTPQEQYVSALQQIIVLLTKQVELLVGQLNALQTNPPVTPVPVTVITTPTLPANPPSFGSTDTPPTNNTPSPAPIQPAPIISKLKVTISSVGFCGDNTNYFNGIIPYMYKVTSSYVGNLEKGSLITLSTDDGGYFDQYLDNNTDHNTTTISPNTVSLKVRNGVYAFYCSAHPSGITITASANGQTATASI